MPTTYSPRPAHPELDRKDPGFGGRPPLRNRPTGGGGDGDNNDDGLRRGRSGPRELLQRYRLALSFVLACDLVFFLALVSTFFVRQSTGHFDAADRFIVDWRPFPLPTALWFATGLLILSSVTVEFGRRQLFNEMDVIEEWLGLGRPMARRTWPWLAATTSLGVGYLSCIALAWRNLGNQGIRFTTNPDSAFFFVLTASHAVHILAAILLLTIGAVGMYRLRRVTQRQVLVDCAAWFWHAMTGFWLFLFTTLVLTR